MSSHGTISLVSQALVVEPLLATTQSPMLPMRMQQQMEARHGNGLQLVHCTVLIPEALMQGLPGLLRTVYGSIQPSTSLQASPC